MSTEEKLRAYLKRVTADLLDTRRQLAAARSDAGEPIAIVGMACRFPGGVQTPDDLWRLMIDGSTIADDAPEDRNWDLDALATSDEAGPQPRLRRFGGFLHDAADFDADFFEISPREALAMDPQHRLLLETSWEALESAGIAPDSLHGSPTGVWVGLINGDYGARLLSSGRGTAGFGGFYINGTAGSFASGRIAYTLGLRGPALTLDTACSSSLVALHEAVAALRRGECSLALVGGATVMSTSALLVEFTRQGGLAADGRCKAFAAAADGTSFSEGVGVLVLERLTEARATGRRALAVVRGSAVNQDGASNGLTAPSGPAQEQVIRQALADARLASDEVDVVEAHGTGTTLGDPIEGRALVATYGRGRAPGRPLLVGSVKSNIGHTQAAAGIASVIKLVLAMHHGLVPPSLGIDRPTPHVNWSDGELRLVTGTTAWPDTGAPRRAAVSSFSLMGTNAHAVIEQAAAEEHQDDATVRQWRHLPWALSAKSAPALRAQAARLLDHLATEPDASDADIGLSLAAGRAVLRHRAVVVGADRTAFRAGLSAVAAGKPARNVVQGVAGVRSGPGAVFVFPGQGSQWAGMGARLLESSPVFADRVHECSAAFEAGEGWSVVDVLAGRSGARSLDDDDVVQPVLFTVMVSLAALWRSFGVEPAAVIGHSQGEIAAACVAGALPVPDAARIVTARNRSIRAHLAGRGGMAVVFRPAAEVRELLDGWAGRLTVAAVNGLTSTTVSGDREALDEVLSACADDRTRTRRVPVDYASHSAHVDAIEADLRGSLAGITPGQLAVPLYSTVAGRSVDGEELTGGYWFDNLRHPVNFVGAARSALADGHRVFVECSPHPMLTSGVEELAQEAEVDVVVSGTLRRDDGDVDRLFTSLGHVHAAGGGVDWASVFAATAARRVPLPTYPFRRRRFWFDAPDVPPDVRAAGLDPVDHGLLGAELDVAGSDDQVLAGRISSARAGWIADHAVAGTVLLPAAAFLELAAHAAHRCKLGGVAELTLGAPLAVPDDGEIALQLVVEGPDDTGRRPMAVYSRPTGVGADEPWMAHARGVLAPRGQLTPLPDGQTGPAQAWPPPDAVAMELDGAYDDLGERDLHYGPAFRGLRAAWRRDGELYAEVELPPEARPDAERFLVHPALLDAALHAALLDGSGTPASPPRLPFAWRDVVVHATGTTAMRVRLSVREDDMSIHATDDAGVQVLSVGSLAVRPVDPPRTRAGSPKPPPPSP